jgi:FtsP/CotA-like multicopper oxidase with cupredoxin domain
MTASESTQQIVPGPVTDVWRYTANVVTGPADTLSTIPNSYLGPIISLNTGDEVLIQFQNDLAYETTTHWHGMDVPDVADGHPKDAMPPGGSYDYEFIVRNRAGTYWYHPHPDMMTGEQVYRGLASVLIVSDPLEQALALPRDEFDIPLLIQDATFTSTNEFLYFQNFIGFFGDTTLVNGQADFNISAATRMYRLRLLNGSQSRILKLAFDDGTPMVVIGVDGGLLEEPSQYPYVMLSPGERIEIWADFTGKDLDDVITLQTLPYTSDAGPGQGALDDLMTFTIDRAESESLTLPITLIPIGETYNVADATAFKTYPIDMQTGPFTINGGLFSMLHTDLNEEAYGDDLEQITITNTDGLLLIAHPIHFHGRQFQIISRTIDGSYAVGYASVKDGLVDGGWQDTFLIMPGETVQYLVRWSRHPGLYMYHCHNLPHEDMGMMRNFRLFEPNCPSDLTHDDIVDLSDLLVVINAWSTPYGDVTGDDRTNITDIMRVIENWGLCNIPLRMLEPDLPSPRIRRHPSINK